eukprot:CAMPEP_0119571448 /NCGR_PEP_ID=MMETSP1352-20130426/44123_1 /TAXON_ID=265584 /ORGANISM="Stauroneis constricta, Strain CCMP1120" /LENGTH=431 /DNA_ID=CAMNT_0007621129 /DNA_START=791 /DNA_END=2086 /DNA_ORIENTATION=-
MISRKRNVFDILESLGPGTDGNAKNILVRVDFNVPLNENMEITDDSRIRGALPTLRAILEQSHNAVVMSHMGRPKLVQKNEDTDGKQRKQLTLQNVVNRLETLIKAPVLFVDECQGTKVTDAVSKLDKKGGQILLLENLRFTKQEEKNDPEFAKGLANLADAYINDAFGTCHRAHASVSGVPSFMDAKLCGVGALVQSELSYLDFTQLGEKEVVAAIIGGSKVSTKLPVIKGLLNSVDTLVLGGGLAFTFIKALGVDVGSSLLEESMIDTARELMEEAKTKGKKLVLPVDAVCSASFPSGPMALKDTKTFDLAPGSQGIEDGWMGLDVGPKTSKVFEEALTGVTKCVFNGPAGVFEIAPFDIGTRGLVDTLVKITKEDNCITVVGGGDSVAALEAFGKTKEVSYVSTGGGATLELLAGDKLPGVEAIETIQ